MTTLERPRTKEEALAEARRADVRDLASKLGVVLHPAFEEILRTNVREMILVGGWRAGKSTLLALKLFEKMLLDHVLVQKPGLFWLVGPQYEATVREFDYILGWAERFKLVRKASTPVDGSRQLVLAGGVVLETRSAEHAERLRSDAPDGIGVCEAGAVSDEVRTMLQGRAAEKRADIVYSGTLENDEARPQWAWYQELAQAWIDGGRCELRHRCEVEHAAFSWPTWYNTSVFPGGEQDEELVRLRANTDPYDWNRRYAAIPTGVQYAVYPHLQQKFLLKVMSEEDRRAPVIGSAGGLDYGTIHPSSIVVVQLVPDPRDWDVKFAGPRGTAWVRECWWSSYDPGDSYRLDTARKDLARRWSVWRWNVDPNERYIARSYGGEATSYSTSAREARIGLVTARLNLNKLAFDLDGPGVRELYEEMQRVHRRKTRDGQLVLVRDRDDRTAALEDAIEALDGVPRLVPPVAGKIKYRRPMRAGQRLVRRIR